MGKLYGDGDGDGGQNESPHGDGDGDGDNIVPVGIPDPRPRWGTPWGSPIRSTYSPVFRFNFTSLLSFPSYSILYV